jgi:hypothetical protein
MCTRLWESHVTGVRDAHRATSRGVWKEDEVLQHWKTIGLIVLALLGGSGGSTLAAGTAGTAPPTNATGLEPPALDPGAFSEPTEINNKWFPLIPGTQFMLEGESDRGFGLRPHRVLFTVTDVTKVVNGVRTVLVWDRDIHDGQLVEEEIAFFAQDDRRNVWSFGEYPEEYEEGQFIGAPATWLSGIDGAKAGIHMPARSRVGDPPYVMGFAPEVDFFNAAQTFATGVEFCVPLNCYENVLVTDEFSPLEKGHVLKFYAPGVGNIGTEPAGDPEMETLGLVDFRSLSPKARAAANARTLKLDKRAYDVAADVWRDTPRAALADHDDGRRRRSLTSGQSLKDVHF